MKNLAPTYEKLADLFSGSKVISVSRKVCYFLKRLTSHQDKVKIVKVDADGDGKELGQKFGIKGFPSELASL